MLGKYSISRELRSYMLIFRSLVSCNLEFFFLGFIVFVQGDFHCNLTIHKAIPKIKQKMTKVLVLRHLDLSKVLR